MPLSSELKGARATPESRSTIPLPTRTHGAEQMGSASNAPVESFSGGIRVVRKPRGPRPQNATGQADPMEGSTAKLVMPERMSSSSNSSFASDWVAEEADLQRPPTVFTGEYRTRTFVRSGSRLEGPKLRVASSAEKVLRGSTTNAETHRSLSAPKNSASLDTDETPRGIPKTSGTSHQEQTPVARNFCRPHLTGGSLGSNPVTPTKTPAGAYSDYTGTGHPSTSQRIASVQAVADIPLHPKASAIDVTSQEATGLKRDITHDDLASKPGARRFGNIRNIFKTKGGSEKARGRKDENEAPGKEAVTRAKRHAKISPAQISPPIPMADEETPSFTRVTTATRTRAEPPRDGRIRRANLAAMSTGSPQRRGVYRRSQASMPQRISTPSRVIGSALDVAMVIQDEAEAASKVADVGTAVEGLIAKARDAAAPGKREEYLRVSDPDICWRVGSRS